MRVHAVTPKLYNYGIILTRKIVLSILLGSDWSGFGGRQDSAKRPRVSIMISNNMT